MIENFLHFQKIFESFLPHPSLIDVNTVPILPGISSFLLWSQWES